MGNRLLFMLHKYIVLKESIPENFPNAEADVMIGIFRRKVHYKKINVALNLCVDSIKSKVRSYFDLKGYEDSQIDRY